MFICCVPAIITFVWLFYISNSNQGSQTGKTWYEDYPGDY